MADSDFETRIAAALRAPARIRSRGDARDIIMARVRALPSAERPRRMPPLSRGVRHSIAGLALAAGIGSITASGLVSAPQPPLVVGPVASIVIGDSIVGRVRDTLRLVRLLFDDSTAPGVAVVGDFNHWRMDATPMARDPHTGQWTATIALADGDHRYAVVVDNTRWSAPAGQPAPDAVRRAYSILHVTRATN